MRGHGLRNLLGLIVLCVIVRLGFLAFWTENYGVVRMDPDGYWTFAGNLRAGKGFSLGPTVWHPMPNASSAHLQSENDRSLGPEPTPTATRVPLYSLFLAGVHWLAEGREGIALASQAALDAVTCAVIYFLAIAVTGSVAVASLASFFWVIYLPEASQITRFWSEPLCALLLSCALLLYTMARRQDRLWPYALAGLVFGGAALTRPEFVLLPLVLASLLLFAKHEVELRGRVVRAAILALGLILALAPWVTRNAIALHAFVPLTTLGGVSLFVGNANLDDDTYLTYRGVPYGIDKIRRVAGEEAWSQAQSSEVELDRLYAQEARRLIREYPVRFLKLSLVRLPRLWFSIGFGRTPGWTSLGVAAINSLFLVLGVIGLMSMPRAWLDRATLLVLTLLYDTLLHLPIDGLVRFVFPLIPMLVVLSAAGSLAVGHILRDGFSSSDRTNRKAWT